MISSRKIDRLHDIKVATQGTARSGFPSCQQHGQGPVTCSYTTISVQEIHNGVLSRSNLANYAAIEGPAAFFLFKMQRAALIIRASMPRWAKPEAGNEAMSGKAHCTVDAGPCDDFLADGSPLGPWYILQ